MILVYRNPELFSNFWPFFGLNSLLPNNELVFASRSISTTTKETYRLPGEQQSFGEDHLFISEIVRVLCSLAGNETFYYLVVFLRAFCSTRSQLRVHENTS